MVNHGTLELVSLLFSQRNLVVIFPRHITHLLLQIKLFNIGTMTIIKDDAAVCFSHGKGVKSVDDGVGKKGEMSSYIYTPQIFNLGANTNVSTVARSFLVSSTRLRSIFALPPKNIDRAPKS